MYILTQKIKLCIIENNMSFMICTFLKQKILFLNSKSELRKLLKFESHCIFSFIAKIILKNTLSYLA